MLVLRFSGNKGPGAQRKDVDQGNWCCVANYHAASSRAPLIGGAPMAHFQHGVKHAGKNPPRVAGEVPEQ